jgi:Fur family zinc uptake transcriptional regulator
MMTTHTDLIENIPVTFRLTQKRSDVVVALSQFKKAASMYELADYMNQELKLSITAMSVYRILQLLELHGIVLRLETINKYILKPQNYSEQSISLVCKCCFSVDIKPLDAKAGQQILQATKSSSFSWPAKPIEVLGVCKCCSS